MYVVYTMVPRAEMASLNRAKSVIVDFRNIVTILVVKRPLVYLLKMQPVHLDLAVIRW